MDGDPVGDRDVEDVGLELGWDLGHESMFDRARPHGASSLIRSFPSIVYTVFRSLAKSR
jgi:hypothetical protein